MNILDQRDISSLTRLIGDASNVTIIVHIHPDGDAVGSGIAMLAYLSSIGKDAVLVLPDSCPASLTFLTERYRDKVMVYEENPGQVSDKIMSGDLIICQDFNSFARAGDAGEKVAACRAGKILIDHHLDPDRSCFDLCFSETEVSSTAELLYNILMSLPEIGHDARKLPLDTATALMTGMTTDTNNFANSVFPGTLTMASELLAAGVDRDMILENTFNSYKESRIHLMGYLLDRCIRITPDGVAYMILKKTAIRKFSVQDGDTEGFVNIPLCAGNVKMSIFLKEDGDRFRVSIRSKKGISANRIAKEFFNGGGHELASGGKLMIPDDVKNAGEAAAYIEKVTHIFMNR